MAPTGAVMFSGPFIITASVQMEDGHCLLAWLQTTEETVIKCENYHLYIRLLFLHIYLSITDTSRTVSTPKLSHQGILG